MAVNKGEDILKFDDIVFSQHPADENGIRAVVQLYNPAFLGDKDSLELSIVAGENFYSDSSAPYSTYEVMLLNNTEEDIDYLISLFFDLSKLDKNLLISLDKSDDEPMRYVSKENIMKIIGSFKFSLDENLKIQDAPFEFNRLSNSFGDVDFRGYKDKNSTIIEFPKDDERFIVVEKLLAQAFRGNENRYELVVRDEFGGIYKLKDIISKEEREKIGVGDLKTTNGANMISMSFPYDVDGTKDLNDFLVAIKNSLSSDDKTDNPTLKELSNDLLNIAFLDKNERASRLGGFNILVANSDIPQDVKKLTTQIVDLLKNESEIEKINKIETIEGLSDLVSELSEDLSEEEEIEESDIEELENILNKI